MELLDTITRIFMLGGVIIMIGYAFGMGIDSIDRATSEEIDIDDTNEIMDYDEAIEHYKMIRAEEESEVRCD